MEVPNTNTLHVILANKPRLFREMLGKIFENPLQVNVIGEVTNINQLPLLSELLHPDWIVLTLCNNGSFPRIADVMVDLCPEVGILAITENGERARARCREMVYDGMALDELVDVLEHRSSLSHNRSNPR